MLATLTLVTALLVSCQALPVAALPLAREARTTAQRDLVDIPTSGPLDADLPQTATILARDGSLLATVDDIHYGQRRSVPLAEIAPAMQQATIAAEDRRFYEHPGVDPLGLLRALTQDAGSDGLASGASTLEMQLARNLFLPDERSDQTLARKLKEALTAYRLDQRYAKSDLLEAYLNTVYYGDEAYGVEAAAERFFGTSASDLSLAEAALLAGLPQSPTDYDPISHFETAKRRQAYVLDQMEQAGFITPAQANAARAAPLRLAAPGPVQVRAPHWVNYVQDVVRQRFGPEALFTAGLRIQTTLDPGIQALAEQIVAGAEPVRQLAHANNSSMVVIDPRDGQVLALVGSKDFFDDSIGGQYNVALAGRQPGSSIKPLVYLAGFEHGLNPAVEVLDQPTDFSAPPGQPPYRPTNFENHFFGRVTLRDALGNSLNVPAVKVLKYVGVPALQEMARRLGISTLDGWDPRWLSLTLGGGEVRLLELTDAYATIAHLGNRLPLEPFLSVETARGETLYQAPADPQGEQVVDPRLTYQLLHVMGDPGARLVTFGPNTPLDLDRPHMVKTGTTDDYRDTWTLGCVPQVCVGVWLGNTNDDPMVKVSSSLTAGKLWVDMMHALAARYGWPPTAFPRPEGLEVTRVPNIGITRPGQADHEEVFLPGHEEHPLLEMDWTRPD